MRMFPLAIGLVFIAARPAPAQDHEECQREIRRLQERLDLLEEKMAVLLATTPAPVSAPPASAPVHTQNVVPAPAVFPPELVPEIGKIGAEVGLVLSGSSNPFHLNNGQDAAGYIDLPLFEPKAWRGKFSYEILVGLSQAKTRFVTTSNVAQVANLSALTGLNPANGIQNLIDAVSGTGAAPFPVRSLTETRSKVLQVVPFSLKYQTSALEHFRLRPYAVLGFGTFVTIHQQRQVSGGVRPDAALPPDVLALVKQIFGGTAPFGAALVAGQIAQSAELTARGLPIGAGNIDFGLHTGGGVEFRLTPTLSLGFDGRYNRLSGGQTLGTFGTRIGLHF